MRNNVTWIMWFETDKGWLYVILGEGCTWCPWPRLDTWLDTPLTVLDWSEGVL